MLLQTNSYIVPKERRAEHARLIRRFRQALARIGCDQFEVYEQVGANWSPGGANGRYVQIMRFRDRQHQQAVQAAEANDPGAQQIIAEFCDLINFAYQQQHGYFATGFYTSVLPTGPRHAVEREVADVEELPEEREGAPASESFSAEATTPSIDTVSVADAASEVSQIPQETPGADDLSALDGTGSPIDGGKELAEAEAAALAMVAVAEVVEIRAVDTTPEPVADVPGEPDRQSEAAAADTGAEYQEPDLNDLGLDFDDAPMPVEAVAPIADDSVAKAEEVAPSNGTPHDPAPLDLADQHEPAAHAEQRLGSERGDVALHEALSTEETTSSDQFETVDHGLIFEDEDPAENPPTSDEHAEHSVVLDQTTAAVAPVDAVPPAAVHDEPHEELLPQIHGLYGPGDGQTEDASALSSASDLDALLDDANLLDNVPFPGDEPHVPHDSSAPAMAAGHGHDTRADTEGDLLEFEALFGELDQDASEHPNRAP